MGLWLEDILDGDIERAQAFERRIRDKKNDPSEQVYPYMHERTRRVETPMSVVAGEPINREPIEEEKIPGN